MQYTLTYREVVDILTLLRESRNCPSIDIEVGDLKISVRGLDSGGRERPATTSAVDIRPPRVESETAGGTVASKKPVSAGVAPEATSDVPPNRASDESSGALVRAPMLGTFYRSQEPGAKPFVEVGDVIGPQTTIGLIEVMKLFSSVTSGVSGRVVEIFASNGALVEYDQPLIRVEPVE